MAFRVPDSTLEEIRLRTDLVDVISSYGVQVKRAGAGYMACCPFHHEKTPSFSIQPEKGFYHCFCTNLKTSPLSPQPKQW